MAVHRKIVASGTIYFEEARDNCSSTLKEEYDKYIGKMRDKLLSLPRGSKEWWKLSRQLALMKEKSCSIPALKNQDNQWMLDAPGKANLFMETFKKKCVLPAVVGNQFSHLERPAVQQDEPVSPVLEEVRKFLKRC